MQCVILASGKGTRMRPLTETVPKPMLRINDKPILEHTLSFLPDEIDEVIFIINYFGNQIMDYFGDEWNGRKLSYVFQQELNGTGGAIHVARPYLKGRFLVLNGDDLYFYRDLEKMLRYDLSVLAFEVEDPTRFGVFRFDDHEHLVDILEKPQDKTYKLINAGAYVMNQDFFKYGLVAISSEEYGLPQTLVRQAQDVPVKIVRAQQWYPIGYPDDLAKAPEIIKDFLK